MKFKNARCFTALSISFFLALSGCGDGGEGDDSDLLHGGDDGDAFSLTATGSYKAGENGDVYVYNWGEYIDERVIDIFEKDTGIRVHYNYFEEKASYSRYCNSRTRYSCN